MLSQTLGSRFDQDSIVLNGHLVRLGAFHDIKTHNEENGTIDVGFTIDGPQNHYGLVGLKSIKFQINFGRLEGIKRPIYSETNFHPPVNHIKVTLLRLVDGSEKNEEFAVSVVRKPRPESSWRPPLFHENFNVNICTLAEIHEIGKQFPGYQILGCERGTVIPSILHIEYDHTRKMSAFAIGLISGSIKLRNTLDDDEIIQVEHPIPKTFFKVLKACIAKDYDEAIQSIGDSFAVDFPQELTKQLKNILQSNSELRKKLARVQIPISPEIVDPLLSSPTPINLEIWHSFLNSRSNREQKGLTELIDKHRAILQEAWYEGAPPEKRQVQVPLRTMHYLSGYLSSYFSKAVKYLGPLRNEPQAVYSALGHNEPSQVGLKGEYTAAALHINQHKIIHYPSPTTHSGDQVSFSFKYAKLSEACREWLEYMGVLVEYRTRDRGKLGYEIYVKTNKNEPWQDLTHVGVGVSQVLPIVLMALLSDGGDLLIFEQPELHLHPKIQSRLCDFFIAMSSFDRQCLIETHSEYLINRLRRRIVQSRDEKILKNSSVFFVTKSNGLSHFDKVEINRFGVIPDWPEDFFDQTDLEIQKILVDAAAKRREEKKGS